VRWETITHGLEGGMMKHTTEVLDFVIKSVIVRILYFEISENKCGRVFETFIREKFQKEAIALCTANNAP